MTENDLKLELQKLRKEINFHNYRYHVLDDPLISDSEFDQKLIRLKEIEQQHPDWITSDSPTQRAGAIPAEKFEKVRHPHSILSLANSFNKEDVRAWYERITRLDERVLKTDFVVEPKIDGLTVILRYQNGIFNQGTTRGDGEIGEDITGNIRTIRALPLSIPVEEKTIEVPEMLVVRGEAFINIQEFDQLNKKLEENGERTYQNPRNTAAGSLRQLDPALTAKRPLTLLTYSIVQSSGNRMNTQWETLEYLKELGFPVTKLAKLCKSIDEVLDECDQFTQMRDQIPFEVDGMVIKINDLRLEDDLGIVGKDPRGAMAFKFPAREVTTQLKDICINVGRTGVLTPTAALEPVEIGGVIVKQATLHNFDYIAEKDIRIGDRVLVKRAGDVIPYIIGPILDARTGTEKVFKPPTLCPVCLQPVEHYEGGVAWFCVNAACPAQLIRNVEHFVSRGAMDIASLGIKIVEQLVGSGLVKDVADLFSLRKEHLLKLDGFADKKADNLLEGIKNSRNQPLSRLIFALGIHGVGEVAASDLAGQYVDLGAISKEKSEDLQRMDGFGPNTAEAIVDWFNYPTNLQLLDKLKKTGVWPVRQEKTSNIPQALQGMTFVVTGTLTDFTREEVKTYIQSRGGKVSDSVSRNTIYLVAGQDAGSKLDKARQLSVKILSESDLRQLAEGSSAK
jgi:DNA ligase (NAD+)